MGKKKTTEQFIEDAKEVHGDRYDYSKVDYKNKRTKVIIICPEHGEFEQTPDSHLQGNGCRKCKYEKQAKRLSGKDTFVDRANKIHDFKYSYENINYKDSITKVAIICPVHGVFEQTPAIHLQGSGCPKCAMDLTKSKISFDTDIFIEKAKKVHGDKYDYSNVVYTNQTTKVEIVCPIHGSFWQTPKKHLTGSGCRKCGYEKIGEVCRKTTEQFIEEAKAVHGNRYDYSEVNYVNSHSDVKIKCAIHGEFYQNAYGHLSGYGCPKCMLKEQNKIFDFIKSEFPEYIWSWEYKNDWLGNQRIDICCENKKLAIEYNGPQHYMPIVSYGGEESYLKTIERDERKQELCKENGFILYVIKYDDVNYDRIREDINNILNSNKNEIC